MQPGGLRAAETTKEARGRSLARSAQEVSASAILINADWLLIGCGERVQSDDARLHAHFPRDRADRQRKSTTCPPTEDPAREIEPNGKACA